MLYQTSIWWWLNKFTFEQNVDNLWLGISKDSSGVWRTRSGAVVDDFMADWAPGEPATSQGSNCAAITQSTGWDLTLWRSKKALSRHHRILYLIQKPIHSPIQTSSKLRRHRHLTENWDLRLCVLSPAVPAIFQPQIGIKINKASSFSGTVISSDPRHYGGNIIEMLVVHQHWTSHYCTMLLLLLDSRQPTHTPSDHSALLAFHFLLSCSTL